MILDKLATFSDAQESTVSVASTDLVDTLAAGDSYEGSWFCARIDTTVTGTSTATTTFQLQTANDATFLDGALTLVASSAYLVASLTAGKFWAVRVPPGAKRYLRAYKVVGGTGINTAGKYDYFIANDIDLDINKRYRLS